MVDSMENVSYKPERMPNKRVVIDPEKVFENNRHLVSRKYPAALGKAKYLLIEENRDEVPICYNEGEINAYLVKKNGMKTQGQSMEITKNAIESASKASDNGTLYFTALLMSKNWQQDRPSFRSILHPVWDFVAAPAEISLGRTGRVLADYNGQLHSEELAMRFSPYLVWDSLVAMSPKRIAVLEDYVLPTKDNPRGVFKPIIVYEGDRIVGPTETKKLYPRRIEDRVIDINSLTPFGFTLIKDQRYGKFDMRKERPIMFETRHDYPTMLDYGRMVGRQLLWNIASLQHEYVKKEQEPLVKSAMVFKSLQKFCPKNTCVIHTNQVDIGEDIKLRITSDIIYSSLLDMADSMERIMAKARSGWYLLYDRDAHITPEIQRERVAKLPDLDKG